MHTHTQSQDTPPHDLEQTLEALEGRAAEMDEHFGLLMDGLKPNGAAWNAADARRADMYSALNTARQALAAARKQGGNESAARRLATIRAAVESLASDTLENDGTFVTVRVRALAALLALAQAPLNGAQS